MVLHTKAQSIEAIKTIARVLDDLNEQVVYVGGAVAGLYADDPGAQEVRPTKDVDIVLKIASVLELETIRQKLAERGIHFAKDEKALCRFTYQNILLDVMATKEVGWAPANPWFKSGFDHPEIRYLDAVKIKIMPLAYYLASKFVAFKDRGSDPRTSHDFEDIVYVLDNRTTLVNDILESKEDVKVFLKAELNAVLNDVSLQEAVLAHLEPATQTQRNEMLYQKLKEIIG
jgi:predicted nucleotidyltransferase